MSFGGVETVESTFDSMDLLPGLYHCRAKIWKKTTILAEAECSLEVLLPEEREDWLAERRSEPIVELEFEDEINIEPDEPEEPEEPENPLDPDEPEDPEEPENAHGHPECEQRSV